MHGTVIFDEQIEMPSEMEILSEMETSSERTPDSPSSQGVERFAELMHDILGVSRKSTMLVGMTVAVSVVIGLFLFFRLVLRIRELISMCRKERLLGRLWIFERWVGPGASYSGLPRCASTSSIENQPNPDLDHTSSVRPTRRRMKPLEVTLDPLHGEEPTRLTIHCSAVRDYHELVRVVAAEVEQTTGLACQGSEITLLAKSGEGWLTIHSNAEVPIWIRSKERRVQCETAEEEPSAVVAKWLLKRKVQQTLEEAQRLAAEPPAWFEPFGEQDLFTLVDEAMSDDDDPISPMDSVSMIGIRMARPAAALCPSSLAPRERLQRGGGDRVRGLPAQQLRIVSSRGEAILAQVNVNGLESCAELVRGLRVAYSHYTSEATPPDDLLQIKVVQANGSELTLRCDGNMLPPLQLLFPCLHILIQALPSTEQEDDDSKWM